MFKWQQEKCECGLDLTTANPLEEIFKKDKDGKEIAFGICPSCRRINPMIYVEDAEATPEPEPEPAPEPEPEPEPAPEPEE